MKSIFHRKSQYKLYSIHHSCIECLPYYFYDITEFDFVVICSPLNSSFPFSSYYSGISNLLTTAKNTSSRLLLVKPQLFLTYSISLAANFDIASDITILPILNRRYPLISRSSLAFGKI